MANEKKVKAMTEALRSVQSENVYCLLYDKLDEICVQRREEYEEELIYLDNYHPDEAAEYGDSYEYGFWDGVRATLLLLLKRGWIKKEGETYG